MSDTNQGHEREEDPPVMDERADLLAQISELNEELKQEHHLDVAIPGYKNLLWSRFRPFEVAKTEAKIKQFQKMKGQGQPMLLASACDTLIDSCEQLMLLPERFNGDIGENGENLIPIDPAAVPLIGFDERVVGLFVKDNPSGSARGLVLRLFATEQAVLALHVRVSSWMQDVTSETDRELLGN